jgi:hypothetical protein
MVEESQRFIPEEMAATRFLMNSSGNQPPQSGAWPVRPLAARLETSNYSSVTGRLSGSAIVFPHLMTLSVLASTLGRMVIPTRLAVLRFITNSNFVGCSIGRSAGVAPFRIFSTIDAKHL